MKFIPKKVDSQFLIRVIKNEVSPEEREYFEKWLAESDANKEEYSSLFLLWEEYGKSSLPELPGAEVQWEKISERISASATKVSRLDNRLKYKAIHRRNYYRPWMLRAAVVVIIVVLSLIAYKNLSVKEELKTETVTQSNPPHEVTKYELVAHKGERITFPLSDGSTVYLNSDSKLIYPRYFADDSRELELIGEAYFSVQHDKQRPFKVKSGKITTVVTGTEFNIVNRNNEVKVVVANGTVNVLSDISHNPVKITKGEKVSVDRKGDISKPVIANMKYELAWRENKLAFINTPLTEIMDDIERCYNVNVLFKDDSIKIKRLTGIFETESLEQMLSLISVALDIKINRQGLTVVVE